MPCRIVPKQYMVCHLSECPTASDGVQLFACPSPNREGFYPCIDDHSLCNDKIDCPRGEDENRTVCMFHKTVSMSRIVYACRVTRA